MSPQQPIGNYFRVFAYLCVCFLCHCAMNLFFPKEAVAKTPASSSPSQSARLSVTFQRKLCPKCLHISLSSLGTTSSTRSRLNLPVSVSALHQKSSTCIQSTADLQLLPSAPPLILHSAKRKWHRPYFQYHASVIPIKIIRAYLALCLRPPAKTLSYEILLNLPSF